MKKAKIIFGSLAALLLMSGCGKVDPSYLTEYEYVNNTEWHLSVTINKTNPDNDIENWHYNPVEFDLAPNESYTLNLNLGGEGGFKHPFDMPTGLAYSVVISNGESRVVSQSREDDIFNIDKYILISSDKTQWLYKFIIEPEFFDNAEPIDEYDKTR
jgi:hypothetical protein